MPAAIRVAGLHKSYGATPAVVDLSFAVEQGEFLGFLGPNGAGKTTTIRILTGIIRPDAGDVTVGGFTLDQREAIARMIGVVPESRGFYDWMTASEYLEFFARVYNHRESGRSSLVGSLLEAVDLTRSRDIRVGAFSRGMKQRLGLARALVNQPQILFLDEPTLGLDPQGQQDIRNLLRTLNAGGTTVFLSSHLLSEVAELCSRIAVIDRGRLVGEGTIDDLRRKAGLKPNWRVRVMGDLRALESAPFAGQVIDRTGTPPQAELLVLGDLADANRLLDELRARRLEVVKLTADNQDLEDIFMALTRRQQAETSPGSKGIEGARASAPGNRREGRGGASE